MGCIMALLDEYDFDLLVNETERLIIDELERQLAEIPNEDIHLCQDCVLDMAALALNSVKPMYRANLIGRLYARAVNEEYGSEIKKAVTDAIFKISENPSHG